MDVSIKYFKINNLIGCLFSFLFVLQETHSQNINLCKQLPNGAIEGSFEIDGNITAGCSPLKVKVNDKSGGNQIRYLFGYEEDKPTQLDTNKHKDSSEVLFSYLNSKRVYTILQYGHKNGKPMYSCKQIAVLPVNKAIFTTAACNEYLEIIINDDSKNDFSFYKIDWGDGKTDYTSRNAPLPIRITHNYTSNQNFQDVAVEGNYSNGSSCSAPAYLKVNMNGGENYPNISSLELNEDKKTAKLTFTGAFDFYDLYQRSHLGNYVNGKIDTKIKPGTYEVRLMDSLQSCFKLFRNFGCKESSGEVCTTSIKVNSSEKNNLINWTNHPINIESITYDAAVVATNIAPKLIITIDGTTDSIKLNPNNPYLDSVNCRSNYCYQIENTVKGNIERGKIFYESISKSQKTCVDRKTTKPDPITSSIFTVNEKNQVEIEIIDNSPWPFTREYYTLHRKDNESFIKVDSSKNKIMNDSTDASKKQICYKIGFVDECENISELSPEICTVYLNGIGNQILWTNNSPFGNEGIDYYELLLKDESSQNYFQESVHFTNSNNLNLDKYSENAMFKIKAVSSNGFISYSNSLNVSKEKFVILPNILSPNDDNINDLLKIYGNFKNLRSYQIEIYNKWGEKIYKFKDTNFNTELDLKAIVQNNNIYFYVLQMHFEKEESIIKKGNIYIPK